MNASLSPARPLAVIAVTALFAAVAAGCGNDVPPSAVAKVGDSTISKDEFNRWLTNAAAGQQAQGGTSTVPDPPDFEKCVASLKKMPAPEGAQSPSDGDLKKQCEDQYDQLKGEVMQFLIQAEWVQQEAADRDVTVSDKEVRDSFEQQKQQAFPKAADYKAFLEDSGMSERDILYRVKLDQLQTKLTQAITKEEVKISEADIEDFYDKNKQQFARPESRDVNLVLTKTQDRANAAKTAIEDGDKFAPVARKFSIDQATKAQGGKLADLTKGQQDQQLEQAAFGAQEGQLEGPVKTQFGFYVFEVTDVTEPSQSSLEEVSDTIRQQLRSQREQKVLDDFIKDFREEYKDKTQCAEDFRIAECGNAPKDDTDTAPPASGGAPQGAPPPQGVPPGAAPQGVPPGATPQGVPPGAVPQGVPPGAAPQGVPPGAVPQGVPPGAVPQGVPPGAVPQGAPPPAAPAPQAPASP
jgi:foldase protein PrsA